MVMAADRLARISSAETEAGTAALFALAPEQDAIAIKAGAPLKFIADDPALPAFKTQLSRLAPTAQSSIDKAELTSLYGGKIAVHTERDNGLIPVNPVYEVQSTVEMHEAYNGRTITGLDKIKGKRQSYAARITRQILRVLIREGDF
jgi:hypothetical protein